MPSQGLTVITYCGAGLTRAILAEMLGLSASALGSVQVALTGTSDSGTEQPAGWEAASIECSPDLTPMPWAYQQPLCT